MSLRPYQFVQQGHSMPAQLISLNGGPNILLDKPILLLGRHPECDIQIDSRKISRRHCCIALVEDYLVVRDLGSTNGVRINGARVLEGKLRHSDELTIGNHRYKVSWGSQVMDKDQIKIPAREVDHGPVDNDDILEECDEPVALDDHEEPPDGKNAGEGARREPGSKSPRVPRTALDLDSEPMSDMPDGPQAMILPENLELAPASDVKEPPPSSKG